MVFQLGKLANLDGCPANFTPFCHHTKGHISLILNILFFLHQFADMDLKDIDCQKRLIKTFVNSVFVYDDKVILTFNYSSDQRTITLNEINGGLQEGVRISPSDVHQEKVPP